MSNPGTRRFVRALQRNAQVCLGLSRANQLRLDSRLLLDSPSQFPSLPAGTGVPANGTRGRKELPVTACLATSNACQTKSRAVRGRGATIPRPSFTNYAEYLLTGGLSPRLLSPPPTASHHFQPCSVASLPGIAERKLLLRSPGGASGGDKGKGARRGEAGRRKVGDRALIWETFQKG